MQTNQHLIDFLNQQIANTSVLHVKLQRYHWYAKGPYGYVIEQYTKNLHEQLDDIKQCLGVRVLAIGGRPIAVMSKFLQEATLMEAEADDEDYEVVKTLRHDYSQLAQEIKITGIPLARRQEDEATASLLVDILGKLEYEAIRLTKYLIDANR
ncbi:Dps family protein [Terribacillus sp. DMT04]|uniref:Dps family protein n=1 Tax=Terribacillus sp. DMT04 TaxID=2850441 RepID=UPI001C2B92C5|nr:ferritin-like domain-containing protein [Terribacillus sp. DMT04]QXE03173.1 DNA starvation/stationary phase protection protein [Terribacillus sp. DMT04]